MEKHAKPVLRLENVSKLYEGEMPFLALDRVSLDIREGELIAIIGPSGSGKSTLLHMLGCLDTPTGGEIEIGGQRLSKMNDDEIAHIRRDTIGFVFQSFNLAPTLSVFKNVELPLMLRGMPKLERAKIVNENLAAVGMFDKAGNLPSQLSGGQKQRAAVARALANQPKIILADEPTGNLDSKSSEEVMARILSLCRERGITVIIITHDARLAQKADRIVSIIDGKIESDVRKRGKAA
ncbi:MAG: ABC transporter ATP-binding protein [Candidatus Micrarchaeia archaeon]